MRYTCAEGSHADGWSKYVDGSVDDGVYEILSQPSSDRVGRALLRFLDLVAPARVFDALGGQQAPSWPLSASASLSLAKAAQILLRARIAQKPAEVRGSAVNTGTGA